MSLRTKFYLSFLVMILLVAFTGSMAIRAFLRTNVIVEDTRGKVSEVAKILTPVSNLVTAIYTDINQASLRYYAYSYNQLPSDYEEGLTNVGQIRDRTRQIEELLKNPRAASLQQYRQNLSAALTSVEAMAANAVRLQEAFAAARNLQQVMDTYTGETRDVILDALDNLTKDLETQFRSEDTTPDDVSPIQSNMLRVNRYLNNFNKNANQAEVLFWQGRSTFGPEASKKFEEAQRILVLCSELTNEFIASHDFKVEDVRRRFQSLAANVQAWTKAIKDFDTAWTRIRTETVELDRNSSAALQVFDMLDVTTAEMTSDRANAAYEGTVGIDAIVDRSTLGSLIILVAAVVIGGLLAFFLTRGIVNPIDGIIENLTQEEKIIGSATDQISEASSNLADGVTEQASSLEETSAALEEVASMTQNSASHARKTSENIQRAAKLVTEGAEEMQHMSAAMTDINAKADQISHIIKTIEDIAFQTNLLALNAAVEAARAGEAGKGFAVVADEVRNLSGRSAQAAKDTAELITSTVESVRNGSSILDSLSAGYSDIEKSVGGIKDLISQIATATEEQAQGTEQINNAISQMDKVTQMNAAGAAEGASSVQKLNEQIQQLREDISKLTLIIHGKRYDGPIGKTEDRPLTTPPSHQLPGPQLMRPDYIE